jgi:ABC-type dipeptide/oligopeptide/nickel transport system permease component
MALRTVLSRMAMVAPTLLGVAVVVFVLLRVVPGDPIAMMIGPGASAQDIAALRSHYGFNAPLPVQFMVWLKGVLTGDFGTSISMRSSVVGILGDRLPATIELAILALLLAVLMGGATAITGTLLRRRRGGAVLDGINGLLLALPDFIWALAFVLLFGVAWPVLPLTGRIDPALGIAFDTRFFLIESIVRARFLVAGNVLAHMIMPALALALPLAAVIARILKQTLSEAMVQDYVLLARVKGMSEFRLIWHEALRNAVGPTLALAGVQATFLVGGTVVVERIFAYPGIGNLAIDAVINRDFPLIQGLVLMFGLIFVLINLAIDLALVALNPRLRHG